MSRKKKEFKITISGDKDPELYQWAESLPYGIFSRLIIENLRWMHEKGLLVKGGMALPEILIDNHKIPLNMYQGVDIEIQKKILIEVESISALLRSGVVPAVSEGHEDGTPMAFADHSEQTPKSESLGSDQVGLDDSVDQQLIQAIPTPFKVYRKE